MKERERKQEKRHTAKCVCVCVHGKTMNHDECVCVFAGTHSSILMKDFARPKIRKAKRK